MKVRNVIGALPLSAGWSAVAGVTATDDRLSVIDASGAGLHALFDGRFLAAA